jgi:hypothetical protein
MSRRDGVIVAWHEVPGTTPPQKSRPVGYGLIRAGVGTDSMIAVTKFSNTKTEKIVFSVLPDLRVLRASPPSGEAALRSRGRSGVVPAGRAGRHFRNSI